MADEEVRDPKKQRFVSHVLVEVRPYRLLRIKTCSAVLLDVSLVGFKLEFTKKYKVPVGGVYYLDMPLAPLGISSPPELNCQIKCLWFREDKQRTGGLFLGLDATKRALLAQVVDYSIQRL